MALGTALRTIKVVHTIIWGPFVVVIGAIWTFAAQAHFVGAAWAIAIVLVEVAVLGLNHGQCPLGRDAGRYTDDRRANFDIYLPVWLAARTKVIFGPLFGAAIVFTAFCLATTPWLETPMSDASANRQGNLPGAVRDLAACLGASSKGGHSIVTLTQTGRMKRKLGSASWMAFSAVQTIAVATCSFEWRARFGPWGMVSVCDALQNEVGRLDVNMLGFVPIARTARTPALTRGELMRYLGELAWAPDAILANAELRWREDGRDTLVVGTGDGATAVEVILGLDRDGRIATAFAPDRPQSSVEPICPTPWRGAFSDYRQHLGRWLPFAGKVAWEISGNAEVYWQGRISSWAASAA